MKVLKDGKLKLDRNDRRVGNNMIVRDDGTHMKVMAIPPCALSVRGAAAWSSVTISI